MNEFYREGENRTIKTRIRSFNESTIHVMIFLGDLPFIKQETVDKAFRLARKKSKKRSQLLQ